MLLLFTVSYMIVHKCLLENGKWSLTFITIVTFITN